MTTVPDHRIEALRGPPDPQLAERLIAFWTATGALDEQSARARLPEVLCVAFAPDDQIVGVNSAYADMAPLIRRVFWMYRRLLLPSSPAELEESMLEAAYDELARRYAARREGPVGVCVTVADRAVIERDREAIWPTGFVFAGYTGDDAQVRIKYFDMAAIA